MNTKLLILALLSVFAGVCSAKNPEVTLHITGAVTGDIVLEIYADKVPLTAANFLNYVRTGFYDGLIFHRVMSGFMIQGGGFDPDLVQKTAGPAIKNESYNGLSNLAGTIAMARTPEPHSATSQFFINILDNPFLDYGALTYDYNWNVVAQVGYCVFGRIISGLDIVDAISILPTSTQNGMSNVPVDDVIIHAAITYEEAGCFSEIPGDINGDCMVDMADFFILAEHWLFGKIVADIDIDGKVNYDDYSILASHWMEQDCVAPNWCSGADLNNSSVVDITDVIILAGHWLNGV